jgi:hypothetical protein
MLTCCCFTDLRNSIHVEKSMLILRALLLCLLLFWVPTACALEDTPGLLPPGMEHAALLASPAVPADYFDLERQKIIRWNDQTKYIMVYIADGSYLPGWNPENPQRVKAAFQEWEQAMAPRFHFIYMPDERGADVKVLWAARIAHDEIGEASGINETATWGKFVSKNDIKLALLNPSGVVHPPTVIQSVALHEIGHMLGLKAHSNLASDIMYPSSSLSAWTEVQHLSQRDVNTLRRVYESKADYSNPEGYHLSNFDHFKKTQHGRRMTMLWIPIPGVPFPVPIILPF